ncbi:pyridoxamine 5'-phosphate oxidase family protein [Streptomyces sp. CRN 30]|uniref:pyridoxamine 5'-phosphate oxidase family protein n=1 Tax=Streptomyces sp. CRN 30 TaxID=3075613 RepID=UPI002A822E41|nr:pyridoxamine 5'-phosphate oxidase family protein [Streptomyces sp. CRN 30]
MRATRRGGALQPLDEAPFDVAAFLAMPLVARLATAGPVIRPVWFLWEEEAFWVLTGTWSGLGRQLAADPAFGLVVDTCDLRSGTVRQVIGYGTGEVLPFDTARGRRKLVRYLGPDEASWDPRFSMAGAPHARGVRWARLTPDRLIVNDQSFRPAAGRPVSRDAHTAEV